MYKLIDAFINIESLGWNPKKNSEALWPSFDICWNEYVYKTKKTRPEQLLDIDDLVGFSFGCNSKNCHACLYWNKSYCENSLFSNREPH